MCPTGSLGPPPIKPPTVDATADSRRPKNAPIAPVLTADATCAGSTFRAFTPPCWMFCRTPTWPTTSTQSPEDLSKTQGGEQQDYHGTQGPHEKAVDQAGTAPRTAEVAPATRPPRKKAMRPRIADTQAPPVSFGPIPTIPIPIANNWSSKKVVKAVMSPAQTGPQRTLSRRARESPSLLLPLLPRSLSRPCRSSEARRAPPLSVLSRGLYPASFGVYVRSERPAPFRAAAAGFPLALDPDGVRVLAVGAGFSRLHRLASSPVYVSVSIHVTPLVVVALALSFVLPSRAGGLVVYLDLLLAHVFFDDLFVFDHVLLDAYLFFDHRLLLDHYFFLDYRDPDLLFFLGDFGPGGDPLTFFFADRHALYGNFLTLRKKGRF